MLVTSKRDHGPSSETRPSETNPVESSEKVVLVSGGGRGIGLSIVRRFLRLGCRVAFFGHDSETVAMAKEDLFNRFSSDRVFAATADVTDLGSVNDLFEGIQQVWHGVDILVNNAGCSPKKTTDETWIEQTNLENWNQVLATNLTGAFHCARLAAPHMIACRWGRMINISSLAGRGLPRIAGPHYAASKAGLIGLTRALAQDLAPHGVTVNCVAPGRILSDMTGPAESDVNRAALMRIPLGRLGQPDDIAGIVAFLASEDASFVTGATIDANGGEFAA